ncbi:uncharacterized protein LOC119724541 [Patiria miniata]|uniref:Uncharacterized protein n=1 Tax=Patiria miniata TaxID=46514 RepID=A0A913ZJQ0_PATMI|nr:uncharacterized protein LOC119724541 [Patiria miniata]
MTVGSLIRFAALFLCELILSFDCQAINADQEHDLAFVANLIPPGIFVAPTATFNFTRIPGLDDHIQLPIDVDYDPVDGMAYWTDTTLPGVCRAFLDGTGFEVVVSGLQTPEGLSLDVENRVMYWTDTGSDLIQRATLDGQNRSLVLNLSDPAGAVEPRSIVVDASNSHLYWTDWGANPKIERSSIDGSGRRTLVNTRLKWPNGLALDPTGQRLYWCDAFTDRIESSDLQGGDRKILLDLKHQQIEPFDIGVYDGYVYWTDWAFPGLLRVDFELTAVNVHGSASFDKAGGLRIYKDTFQDHSCRDLMPCQNGGRCRQFPSHYECVCSDRFTGTNCEKDLSELMIIGCPGNTSRLVDDDIRSVSVSWPELNVSDPSLPVLWNSNYQSGDMFPLGSVTMVTFMVSDEQGNVAYCNFTVEVTGVGLDCPSNVTSVANPGVVVANVSWDVPSVTFNGPQQPVMFYDGSPSTPDTSDTEAKVRVYADYQPGDTFSIGHTRVTYRVQGLETQCHFHVIVTDLSPPTFISGCPGNISRLTDDKDASVYVSWPEVTAYDPNTPLLWNRSHRPGDMFPVGSVTMVTYVVTDQSRNSAYCRFTVSVTGVGLDCPSNVTSVANPGVLVANVSWNVPIVTFNGHQQPVMFYDGSPSTPDTSDAEAKVRVYADYQPGDTFSIGHTRVTYRVQGLETQCHFHVIVADTEAPEVNGCPADVTIPVISSSNQVVHRWDPPTSTDNSGYVDVAFQCSGTPTTDCNQAGSGTFSVGVTVVAYHFKDQSQNKAVCTFTVEVTVVDLVCPASIRVLAKPGSTRTSVHWMEPDLTGWSGPTNFTASADSGTVFSVGRREVDYWQWFEPFNLVLECSFSVMVVGRCVSNTTLEGPQILTWPVTISGSTAKSVERCKLLTDNAGQPLAERNCSVVEPPVYFQWEQHEPRSCGENRNEVTIQDVEEVEVSQGNAIEVAEFLANQTSESSEDAEDVEVVSNILVNIARAESGDTEVTKLVVKTVSNVIKSTASAPDSSTADAGSSSAIVHSVETQVALTLRQEGEVSIRQDTIHVEAVSLDPKRASGGFSFVSAPSSPDLPVGPGAPQEGTLAGTEVKTFENASDIPDDVVASIRLPANIVDLLQSSSGNTTQLRASFIVYADDTLFKSALIKGSTGKNGSSLRVAGSVVSLAVEDVELVNLTEPVVIEFKAPAINETDKNRTIIHCVFWDFQLNDNVGDWSRDGCSLSGLTIDRVSCHCGHATNFAILLDVKGQAPDDKDDTPAKRALDIISQVGAALSIIALAITLILYLAIRKLRSGKSRQIFIHFCASLLMLYIVFLAGVDNARGSGGGCVFVAALLHYLTLSTMMWMAVEARNMYVSTVKVFPEDTPRYMLKACLIAWGSPLIVLTVTLAAAIDHYQNEHYCFLEPGLVLYLSLLAPIGLILIHNIITFILVMRSLLKVKEASRSQQISKRLQNAVGISALMGVTWCFGFLAIEGATFAFQLIFCLANSLQGVIVFIMFCVRREEVRAIVAPYLGRICCGHTCRLPKRHANWSYELQQQNESAAPSSPVTGLTKFDLSSSGR